LPFKKDIFSFLFIIITSGYIFAGK